MEFQSPEAIRFYSAGINSNTEYGKTFAKWERASLELSTRSRSTDLTRMIFFFT